MRKIYIDLHASETVNNTYSRTVVALVPNGFTDVDAEKLASAIDAAAPGEEEYFENGCDNSDSEGLCTTDAFIRDEVPAMEHPDIVVSQDGTIQEAEATLMTLREAKEYIEGLEKCDGLAEQYCSLIVHSKDGSIDVWSNANAELQVE